MRVNLIDIYMDENIENIQVLAQIKLFDDFGFVDENTLTIEELNELAYRATHAVYRNQLYRIVQLMQTFGKMWHESINK